MNGVYDLERFVAAQAPVFDTVLQELRAGRKQTHWMWFVFPQLAGLGCSGMARRYAISSTHEAFCYLRHAVLGGRLLTCTRLVNAASGRSARQILGTPDDMKLRSCMTLFQRAEPTEPEFGAVLQRYFDGVPDALTLDLLGA